MIDLSVAAQSLQASARTVVRRVRVESWLSGELLADDIPIAAGDESVDRTGRIPERVTLTVPRVYRGESWSPLADPEHPLAAGGQRLRVSLGVDVQDGTEWIQRGEFLVQRTELQGDDVRVEAVGLLALVDEARLVSPYQPTGTLASTLRGLIEPALTVVFDSTLVDRAVPSAINYDEDRLGAVQELLDAWPAQAAVTNEGYLLVEPVPTPTVADFSVADSNTVRVAGVSTRDDVYNAVVARGTASDGTQVQAVAYASSGVQRYPGPFSPLPVPFYFASPLLTTVAQCRAAAATVLARKLRQNAQPLKAEIVPRIDVQGGDAAYTTTDDGAALCTVEALQLPYTAGGGPQQLTLVEVA